MGKAIEVRRTELSALELRAVAAGRRDGAVVRRLLAIALILEGQSRAEAARLSGMDRQTLRDWVHRYNDAGVDGLRPRMIPGRPGALNEAQLEELRTMVLDGPDPTRHQVIRWRCCDLREEIAARWSVVLTERSVGRLLHRLGMTRLQPRPHHPQKDAVAQEAFKTYGPPRPQGCRPDGVSGLHQRIRSQGRALAKMDIRASRVLIKASASSAAFRTRISRPPV